MLEIRIDNRLSEERKWIISTLVEEFLGLKYKLIFDDSASGITLIKRGQSTLTINECFFSMDSDKWLKRSSLPSLPLSTWIIDRTVLEPILVLPELPVIYGKGRFKKNMDGNALLELDIFGSAFFMMSRYEEVVLKTKDRFGRFPASASVAVMENFIERPIINEYIEVLWSSMKTVWPDLTRKNRRYKQIVTCDVDRPYQVGTKNVFRQIRTVGADFLIRKSVSRALQSLINYFFVKFGSYRFDPYYSRLHWIMNENERVGNKVIFYFLATDSINSLDGSYAIEEKAIRKILRLINNRGHIIGLHPSLDSFTEDEGILNESNKLKKVLQQEGVEENLIEVRQHYLAWDAGKTPIKQEAADLKIDSSMAFAERCGFRAGICYEYDFFSITERRRLCLRIRPLIVMETSLLGEKYMAIQHSEDLKEFVIELSRRSKLFNGDFVFLWHNDSFEDRKLKMLYRKIISSI